MRREHDGFVDWAVMSVYLDHAATTPVLPQAVEAMTTVYAEVGNPSSLHAAGRAARRRVEEAREELAGLLGARPSEIIFTGGGTEADNLAVKGLYWARRGADPARRRIVASPVEHHAILDSVDWLAAHEDAQVTWLDVDAEGTVTPAALERALAADPASVAVASVMWANNEVGTVAPIAELAAVARRYGVPFHTDAVQAVGALPVDFAASGVEALTLTGHKFGGPGGTGALLLRRDVACTPVQHGGGQERDVRSGTVDAAGIAGFVAAAGVAIGRQPRHAERLTRLRERLIDGIVAGIPDVVVNGSRTDRLPGNVHVSFPGCEGDSLLMLLDAQGVQASTGSACTAGVARASHVLIAMGVPDEAGRGSVRLSLGHTTTDADVEAALDAIGPAVQRARSAGIVNRAADRPAPVPA